MCLHSVAGCSVSGATAGPTLQQTAEHVLPVAFRLLEAAVEVLASDADDGAAALDPRHDSDTVAVVPGGMWHHLCGQRMQLQDCTSYLVLSRLDETTAAFSKDMTRCYNLMHNNHCRVAGRALDTLDGAFEAILQFLEEVLSPGGQGDGPLALAALRALARCGTCLRCPVHVQRCPAMSSAMQAGTWNSVNVHLPRCPGVV